MNAALQQSLDKFGLHIKEQIGEGSYAKVYVAEWDSYPNEKFAAKVITRTSQISRQDSFENEIAALSNLYHPNIIKLFKYIKFDDYFILVFEYCPLGSITRDIKTNGSLTRPQFICYAQQIISALKECHMNCVAHRDIKPDNILIDNNGKIKLTDFGLSNKMREGEKTKEYAGSLSYIAPEIILRRLYDPLKADIWALGVTFFYMLTGTLPFDSTSDKIKEYSILNCAPSFPAELDEDMTCFLKSMLIKDASKRPTANELLEASIFNIRSDLPIIRKSSFETKYQPKYKLTKTLNVGSLPKHATHKLPRFIPHTTKAVSYVY